MMNTIKNIIQAEISNKLQEVRQLREKLIQVESIIEGLRTAQSIVDKHSQSK